MKFVILGWDGPKGQAKRPQHRAHHLERLKHLQESGRLICAGPFLDKAGSLIIIEADSLSDAETFANGDPYVTEGIFERIEVHPFKQVFPEQEV